MRGSFHATRAGVRAAARAWIVGLLVVVCLVASGIARAQPLPDSSRDGGSPAAEPQAAPDSPRASLAQFLELCRAGRYSEAAVYVDASDAVRGAELARKLKAVLDRHVWFDLAKISPVPGGDPDDVLQPAVEQIGAIPNSKGGADPVLLVRRADEGRWVFSRSTVDSIDAWYGRLDQRWLFDHLPAPLLRPGPRDLLYWQWLALPLLLLIAWGLGHLLSRIARRLAARMARRTATHWDDDLLDRMGGPLTVGGFLAVAYLLLPSIELYASAQAWAERWLRAGFFVVFFWSLARSIDVARALVAESPWAKDHPSSRALLPLGARVGKVVLVAIALVALLSELGYPVASLIAGLGIGGLAVALAAQKTVENLFGAFSIGADQPFREGDFVRIEDFVGTVEAIGLRSTRVRTLDRTLVTIPNGKLAEMRLESFSARDRIRLACTVGLVYDTKVAQMRAILAGLEQVLRSHPKIWPDAVVVRFKEFGASSLDIEVMAWFETADWGEFQVIRQDVLLQFMDVVDQAGSSFAFPTRTVHVAMQTS